MLYAWLALSSYRSYQDGWTVLMNCVKFGHIEMMKLLLQAGASKEPKDNVGCFKIQLIRITSKYYIYRADLTIRMSVRYTRITMKNDFEHVILIIEDPSCSPTLSRVLFIYFFNVQYYMVKI